MISKQLTHTPDMSSDAYHHSWCHRYPTMTGICHIQFSTQTLMRYAEIVYCSYQIHHMMECCQLTNKRPSSTHQSCYPRPERSIYAFYVGCMRIRSVLCLLEQQISLFSSATSDSLNDTCYTSARRLLDHLDNTKIFPCSQTWTSKLTTQDRYSEHFLYSRNISHKAIYTEQQWAIQSTATYLLYEMRYRDALQGLLLYWHLPRHQAKAL